MALYVPSIQDFQWRYSLNTGLRPTLTSYGQTITPGTTPTKGAYTQVVSAANMVNDGYGILINFNNGGSTAATRNYHVDIGVDNAGGTTYLVKIPNLMAGHAAPYGVLNAGIWYYFPLYIAKGSSVAVRAAGNVTTAFSANVTVFGQPSRPDSVRAGTKVFAFGATTATATGTTMTLGTTAEGAYAQIGTATTQPLWWWQTGFTQVDTTMTAQNIHLDVAAGDATNKRILIENQLFYVNATEQISNNLYTLSYGNVATGDLIYVRGQSSLTTLDTAASAMVWGLGD